MATFLRFAVFVFVGLFLLFVSACGGGSSGSGSNNDTVDDGSPKTISEFSKALSDSMGEKEAFEAVVLSADKGFTLDQIVAAGNTDRLNTDGNIGDGLGGPEIPANLPSGNFPRAANVGKDFDLESLKTSADRISKDEFAQLFAQLDAQLRGEESGFLLIVYMMTEGYTIDQIVEGLIDDTFSVREENSNISIGGKGPDGAASDALIDDVSPTDSGSNPGDGGGTTTGVQSITDGTYFGTLSDFEFRSNITVVDSGASLVKRGDSIEWEWSVEWEQPARDCVYHNRDSWGGSRTLRATDRNLLQMDGTRSFEVELANNTCSAGGFTPSQFEKVMTLQLEGAQLTGSIGIGRVVFDVKLSE